MGVQEKSRDEFAVDSSSIEKAEVESGSDRPATPGIDPEAEKRLVRKLDLVLLPLFTAIYCCNFIDRTSIGNARVAGLEKDLGMHGTQLNIALTIFYICYLLSDIPSNLLLKHYGSTWLAFLVIGFGVVSLASAFLRNFTGLIISRIFLGLTEGGTLSALLYIVSRYYRRQEYVFRVGIFFGIAPSVSGAFGGLLASGLLRVPDFGSVHSWRKIFLIEGLITTVFGLVLLFFVPEDPSKSKLLSPEERALAVARIDADRFVKTDGKTEKTTWKLVWRSFNIMTISCTVCFVIINMSFQGLSLFLPSVINTLGNYSVVEVQLRTVPPYIAGAVWAVANAYISSRIRIRFLPLLVSTLLAVIGYSITVATRNPHARYAACFLNIMAGAIVGPMLVIWGTDNAAPDTMRAVVTGAIPGIGAIGSVMAVWTYIYTDAPDYRRGNLGNLATTSTMAVLIVLTALYIKWENAKRERGERDHRLAGKTDEEITNLGYRHPRFRYQI
ncbi:MFS general substrate transporter [Coprinellus micaceus]|uniref:MFS general substrate transporter n=1 Tax=Coprinellus micaceus TaxID=71717 RepID=A0A4Y7SMP4_COPMI|nr:MFS general substrate transporter [Coprinellus micaceus]